MTQQTDRLNTALAGRYRIERELGAGGMATVYLAEDLKHDRKVAIKVLKPELAAVLGAERFVVEIKTTAALSHPHILPLFDSGTADGFLFYVMPYIQGETIREKLTRETQFGVDDAVRVAREVADALDYAHRHGVIHRDIKPENLLLHDGRAMVMDFGIALAVSAAAGGRMTETGLSLGTPHYMSPEQATAEKEITARSDQYSLASVLYEMLAGQPPHLGGPAQQVIMRIITEPARSVSEFRKNVPPNVTAAVAKALEKLPADRFESAAKFADALGNSGFVGTGVTGSTGLMPARGAPARTVATLAAIAVVAMAVAVWALRRSPTPAPDAVVRMTLELPPGEHLYVFGGGGAGIIAISPLGDRIAYVAQDTAGAHTYVRRTGELTGRAVAYNAGDLVFSPDGRWLAYSVGAEIRKVSSDGGAVVSIVTDSRLIVRGLAWLRSDTIVIGGFGGLRTVPAAGGTVRVLAGSDTTQNQAYPVLLPDGRTLAFANGQPGARKLALLAPGQARYTQLDVPALAPIGMAEGQLMFVAASGALMALPIDLAHQRATGDPTQVEAGIRQTGTGAAMASLSESGTLWYVTGESMGRLILSDASGAGAPLFDDRRLYRYPRFSPDGRKVAVGVTSGPVTDIWVYDRVNRTFQKLTTVGDASTPEWSPDGKHILFRSVQSGKNEIWWLPSDGSGKAEPLYQGEPVNEAVISPDAKWLLYRTSPASKFSRDIFALPLTGSDRKPVLLVGGPSQESHPRLSPDGKWLAYQSNESGRFEVYVRPFPNEGARTQVSTSGGQEPIWSRSGNELYYRTSAGITSTTVTTGATFSIRARKLVLPSGATDDLTHQNYDVSADGRFLTVMASGGGASAILVHNWARDLREKLALGKR